MNPIITAQEIAELVREMPFPVLDESEGAQIASDIWSSLSEIQEVTACYFRHPFKPDSPPAWARVQQLIEHLSNNRPSALQPAPEMAFETAWMMNLRSLGNELEFIRGYRFWSATQGAPDLTSLKNPKETKALFARAVFLHHLASRLAHPATSAELVQVRAMADAIVVALNHSEGKDWDWDELIMTAVEGGTPL